MTTRTSKSKTETNALLLKSLLKLPGNKYCCDCKTADHPRWASWNLGIFLCIRCSGIHRSMGTHISRVKSVDLDAWTDEQTQSMVRWGNKKANQYWENKLDSAHIPSDGKIDNFVKTKYVSRRWISQDQRPDPEDLSDDEAEIPVKKVPNSNVKEIATTTSSAQRPQKPSRATEVTKAQTMPMDSLLGLDLEVPSAITRSEPLVGQRQAVPSQPFTASNLSLLSTPAVNNLGSSAPPSTAPRNDLKMSIMSLYASAPKPQQYNQVQSQQARTQPATQSSMAQPATSRGASAFDDLNGLFGGMNVSAAAQPQQQRSQFVSPSSQSFTSTSYSPVVPNQQPILSQPNTSTSGSWGTDDDAWGGFQGHQPQSSSSKPTSVFDDLYSTSDVWK